ncbi:hypothetical protein [Falsibacillus albus]|uniref:Uncharacterized protein n=1 Tax=Falsibacillus albus TaxID=2478915 RepID=A0A3L7JU18_9BACI|nr:hypothetical protein [Falsibacillus albus]RLQ93589.1 hypothetical protein D9X91_16525 [Falsibacillus albus]
MSVYHEDILHIWQPTTALKGRNPAQTAFKEIVRHDDYFKISIVDAYDTQVDLIYDQHRPSEVPDVEYYVWAYRYGTEYGRFDLNGKKVDETNRICTESSYFFKVSNSEFIKWFDKNPLINSFTHPTLEHHLYLTGDEVLDVLSIYEPKIIIAK